MTEASAEHDDLSATPNKVTTTVAMDFGRVSLDADLILYLFGSYTGTSIITGFALTLFIGVAVSMFTAITVTRTLLRGLVATGLSGDRWWFGASPLPHATPAPAAD